MRIGSHFRLADLGIVVRATAIAYFPNEIS